MTDPVDHALLELRLKKAHPKPLRRITLIHQQSRAEKSVEYLGMSGEPLRALIHWPIAGQYLIAPRSGTILGSAKESETLRHWKVSAKDHAFLKQEYRLARARVPLRPERVELAKCR
jgi:hypothetical protein